MLPPDCPPDEELRLKALKECGLLDTPSEEKFDRLTRLARQHFETDIVLISLIDENRQWFKSKQGLEVSETGRDISICGHAILSPDIFYIPDTFLDWRFSDNPLVTGAPFIRFYAGAPLTTRYGQRIGTLCIIDRKPRHLSQKDRQMLRDFADCIEHEINNELAQRQHNALLTLTRITSLTFQDPQALLRKTLALGCQYLQLSTGAISRIQGRDMLIQASHTEDNWLPDGQSFPKEQTYSDLLDQVQGPVHIQHMGNSLFRTHPAYQKFKQETYIGIPLHIEGKRYGTLAFSGSEPRTVPFSSVEIEFVNVLGDWVNSTLKRQELNQSLQRQQELNEGIASAQSQFIKGRDSGKGFDTLLATALKLTDSDYGFICEILENHDLIQSQKTATISELRLNADQQGFTELNSPGNEKLTLLHSSAAKTLLAGDILLWDAESKLSASEPSQYPDIRSLLGLPIRYDGELLAVLVITGRMNGYDSGLIDFLQPMLISIGQFVNAARVQRQHDESEKRLANIIEGTNIGTWECHVPSGNTVFNERWAEMLGYTLAELAPTTVNTWLRLCHPDDMLASDEMLQKHFRGELPYYDLTGRMRHKDGHWVWIRDRGCVVSWSEDGKPLLMSGSHQDVTQERLAEEKLAHAYELLEQSNAAAHIGTWEYDVETKELHWSKVTRQIHEVDEHFRCNSEEALAFYKGSQQQQKIRTLIVNAIQQGKRFDAEFEIVTARQSERWVRVIGLPQFKDYKIHKVYGTFQDISDSKANAEALRDQAAHTQAILDNVLDGIITVNHHGYIDAFNFAAASIFGYHKDELIGRHISILLPVEGKHNANLGTFRSGEIGQVIGVSREIEARRKDGSIFPLDLSISAVKRRGRPLYIGLMRDITERKRLEKIKNEFISTVSHELRTPLTSISGALGLILGGVTGHLPESLTPLLRIASKNSQRLTFLINDLLDMEKLGAGKMHFHMQKQALQPLLIQALETNTTLSIQRKVQLQLISPVPAVQVEVDSQRLMQILTNLLSNAIKYSPENEVVEVRASVRRKMVRISISDRGNGIPHEFRERIFQKFAQADSSDTREKGGTGLGLAISRELAEYMGGQIGFDSVTGAGSNFYIELPIVN